MGVDDGTGVAWTLIRRAAVALPFEYLQRVVRGSRSGPASPGDEPEVRMRRFLMGSLLLLLACGPADDGDDASPEADTAPAATSAWPDSARVARGREVFDAVCSQCHTLQPPPDSAPPMSHVAQEIRARVGTLDAFTEHILTYVPEPDPDRSLLPPQAIERFGLMQAWPLGEDMLRDVAGYVWTLADSAGMGGMSGMGMGGMGGMGMGGMRRPGNR